MIVSLFEGRHELPTNEGAICSDFDFSTFKAVRTELWEKCIDRLYKDTVKLIVTGLTPALCEFLVEAVNNNSSFHTGYQIGEYKDCPTGSLILLHYDSVTKDYWEQVIF